MMPASYITLVQKRAYSRCMTACSAPPTYRSTGSQYCVASGLKAASALSGSAKRRKYHEEQANPPIVSVSRFAGPPHVEQVVWTNSGILARGDSPVPVGW